MFLRSSYPILLILAPLKEFSILYEYLKNSLRILIEFHSRITNTEIHTRTPYFMNISKRIQSKDGFHFWQEKVIEWKLINIS